jgi:hypothetical protein
MQYRRLVPGAKMETILQNAEALWKKSKNFKEKNPLQPVAVWAQTIKGIGIQEKRQQNQLAGGHGFPPNL